MPFTESVKLEAKRRAHFRCVACHEPWVVVHHIAPQADGGPDTIGNAAPLCARCHDLCGGNPEKRKQIREMRDFWWEFCERDSSSPQLVALSQRLDKLQDDMKTAKQTDDSALGQIKGLLIEYHQTVAQTTSEATSFQELARATGMALPDAQPWIYSDGEPCPACKDGKVLFSRWGVGALGVCNAWFRCSKCGYEFQTLESASD